MKPFTRFGDPMESLACREMWERTIRKPCQRRGEGIRTQTGGLVGEHPSLTINLGGWEAGAVLSQGAQAAGAQRADLKVLPANSHHSKPLASGMAFGWSFYWLFTLFF